MHRNYIDRMMRATDPRYRKIAERLGYCTREMRPLDTVSPEEELEHLRAKYRRLTGRTADKRWSPVTLLAKCAEAQD